MDPQQRPFVVHLTTVHPAHDIRIHRKMCSTLVKHGFEVAVMARHDREETIAGVRIVPLPGEGSTSRWSRFFRSLFDAARALRHCQPWLVHFHDPELIPLGVFLRFLGWRVVYDAHEDLPRQILTKEYLPRQLRPPLAWACGLIEGAGARCLSGVVAATPTIARRFPVQKTALVQNFPILGELQSKGPLPQASRPPEFVYVGGIGRIRGIREMVSAAALTANPETRLILAGEFETESLLREVQTMPGWTRTEFVGWQSREQVTGLLARARAGLVLFHPAPNHVAAQPNKLFEYMSAGLPVVASDFPLWREIVGATGCGLLVDPLNPEAIARAMTWILDHPDQAQTMGERGRRAVEEKYNWARESETLLSFYRSLGPAL